jgi:aminomethyltransferase
MTEEQHVSAPVKLSAFHDCAKQAGATFTEWGGWKWVDHYDDPLAEHLATREQCNIWDESPLRKWDVTGPDAMALADVLFANDMASLRVGQVRYGPMCDPEGMMIMDGTVFKVDHHHCIVMTAYDSDFLWMREVAADRDFAVQLRDVTQEMPHLQVQGPMAREVLRGIARGVDVDQLAYFRFVPEGVSIGGLPVMLSRTGYSGELGFEIFCTPAHAPELWETLMTSGKPFGIRPVGLSAIETLRIEAGLLFVDVDYFQHKTDPFEVGLDFVVNLNTPGDFVGKASLQQLALEGGPPRRYVTLHIEADVVPEYGATVFSNAREVGQVRSPCRSPSLEEVIGLAAVDRDIAASVGATVQVAVGDETVRARVGEVPAYDTAKRRPRS